MRRQDDEPETRAAERVVYEAREHLQAVRNQYWRERVSGTASPETKRELAVAAIQLYDVLWEHHDEDVIQGEWEASGVDELREKLNEEIQVATETSGRSGGVQYETRPAILGVDGDRLVAVSKSLEKLAKGLGFSANVSASRPIYHAGKLDTEDYDEPVKDGIPKPQ